MMIVPVITPQIPVALPTPVAVEPPNAADTENKSKQKDGESDNSQQQKNTSSHEGRAALPETNLTEQETAELQKLAARDREVRAHEAAHKGAAGPYGGATEYTYTRGPNGKQYATGGEVAIDLSTPSDPQEALRKAQTIQRAALAPAQPSGQDRAVAAQAANMATEARVALQKQADNPESADKTSEAEDQASEIEGKQERNELDVAYAVEEKAQGNEIDYSI